uniref:Uncharacterized protein n=1 Tax=Schistocephalus solidus TaxID=70667 RepID=A0A0X3NV48_SCHSO
MYPRLCIILSTVFALTIHAFPPEGYGPIGQRRCFQPVRIEIPECQNTFYNFTGLPNLVGQESQVDARHQLQTFKPLITYKCSNQLAFFLCSVYAPMCDINTHHLIGPCRPLCERVRKRCSPILRIFDFDWPANLNCSRFPERNTVGGAMCMEGPEAAEDDGMPAVDADTHGFSEGEVGKAEWPWPVSAQKASATSSHSVKGELREEKGLIPAEGIIRQIEDLPEAANVDLSKLGSQLQNWLARLNQNPLSAFLGNNEIPVALLVSSLRFCSHLYKPTSYIFINRTGRCAPHCSADVLFSQNAKTLATVWTSVISGLCLLATTCTLLSYAIQPSLFHPLERPIIYIAGCQLAYALGFALRLKLGREAVACGVDPASGYSIRLQEGLENSNCALVFLVQYYFFVAGAIWWAMMVIGWTRRTTYAYRLMDNPCRDSGSTYVPSMNPYCCLTRSARVDTPFVYEEAGVFIDGEAGAEASRPHGSSSGVNPATVGPSGGASSHRLGTQPAATSSLRASHVNRRIQTTSSNSIDLNCLAKEHVIAWLTPGLLTVAVLVTRQVDADELLGICSVGRQNTRTMLIFMLVPQFLFLLLGLVAFVVCAFYLHKLGRLPDRKRFDCLVPSATMSHLDATPARCLTFQVDQQGYLDPSYDGINTSEASSACFSGQVCCCCRRSLRWDGISTRLGFFTLLYVIPAISIFICDFYEFLFRDSWLAGDPSTAVSSLLQSHAQFRGRITPEIFLLRTFMSLVTGLATCLWLLSIKGIEPWRHLAKQIESRCARYGYFCFFHTGSEDYRCCCCCGCYHRPRSSVA